MECGPMSRKLSVVLVEDEESIREGLEDVFTNHGYGVASFADGESALVHATSSPFDVAVLDVMLPGINGFELCAKLRKSFPAPPILMLTAKGSEEDVLRGFCEGADDYVTKPFSIRELLARLEVLLRRGERRSCVETPIVFGPWTVDPGSLRAIANGELRDLTQREVDLVVLFAREKGRIVSRRRLLKDVWGMNGVDEIETRTVDMHIAKLRKKLDPQGRILTTVRGAGYRFED